LITKCNSLEKLDIALEDILFLYNKFDMLKKLNNGNIDLCSKLDGLMVINIGAI